MSGVLTMKRIIQKCIFWLLLGPALALLVALPSWYVFTYFSPDKLTGFAEMIDAYPTGLMMSLLAPWGWLMYGGLFMMVTQRTRLGVICTVAGAIMLGVFWPVWSTFLVSA